MPIEPSPKNYQRLHVELVREEETVEYLSEYPAVNKAKQVYDLLAPGYANLGREHFLVLPLDVQNRVIGVHTVSVGTLTSSLVHPREVFQIAILANAASIIIAHNHPSGDPTPSEADKKVTKRIAESGVILGIPLLDHIVIGSNTFHSLSSMIESTAKY